MIYSIDVTIEVPVQPTEVPGRVEDAVTNLFPDAEFRREPDRFVAESHSLDAFSDVLHEQEILDTARREFYNGIDESERQTASDDVAEAGFSFALKKQPALEGVVNFAVGSADELGDVRVRVDVRDPDVASFVDHVAPPTEEGRPIEPEGGPARRDADDYVGPDEGSDP